MSDPKPAADPAPATQTGIELSTSTTTTTSAEPKPPWGSDAEFNAEKAWALVQNIRSDLGEAKTNLEASRKEIGELQGFRLKAQEAEETAQENALSLHRERAARREGLTDEQFEFLSELTDPEAIDKRAALVKQSMSSGPARAVDPTQGSSTSKAKASPADEFAGFLSEQLSR